MIAELEEENLRLQMELKAAEIRRELAEKLPRLGKPQADRSPAAAPGKKTTTRPRATHRKRLQQNTNPSQTDESRVPANLETRLACPAPAA